MFRYSALFQLLMSRLREFYREPAAVFWVYCFPLLMAMALGIAFRDRPIERITVDIREDAGSPEAIAKLKAVLADDERLEVKSVTGDAWRNRLRSGKTGLVIVAGDKGHELWDEPNRPESVLARHAVEAIVYKQRSTEPVVDEHHLDETGSRYIDFLLPGLLGMNLMGGGLGGLVMCWPTCVCGNCSSVSWPRP